MIVVVMTMTRIIVLFFSLRLQPQLLVLRLLLLPLLLLRLLCVYYTILQHARLDCSRILDFASSSKLGLYSSLLDDTRILDYTRVH